MDLVRKYLSEQILKEVIELARQGCRRREFQAEGGDASGGNWGSWKQSVRLSDDAFGGENLYRG